MTCSCPQASCHWADHKDFHVWHHCFSYYLWTTKTSLEIVPCAFCSFSLPKIRRYVWQIFPKMQDGASRKSWVSAITKEWNRTRHEPDQSLTIRFWRLLSSFSLTGNSNGPILSFVDNILLFFTPSNPMSSLYNEATLSVGDFFPFLFFFFLCFIFLSSPDMTPIYAASRQMYQDGRDPCAYLSTILFMWTFWIVII